MNIAKNRILTLNMWEDMDEALEQWRLFWHVRYRLNTKHINDWEWEYG